jgi:O-antigen/teichoic acid export membrane protein
MSSFRSIGRNSVFLGSSQIIEKTLSFLVAILLARYLGKSDYGRLVYAIAFANLFIFFWDFGLARLIIRDVAQNLSDASVTFSPMFKFQIISCLAGILVLSLYLVLFETRGAELPLILIVGTATALNHLSASFRSVFIAFEKAQYETYFNFSLRSVLLLAIFWTICRGWNLIDLSLILLFFGLLNLIGSWRLVERKFFHVQFGKQLTGFVSILKDSFPIAVIIALSTFYLQINKILLLKIVGPEAAGIYGAVDMIVMTLLIISNSLALATFPMISKEHRTNKEHTFSVYKSVFRALVALGLPMALGGTLLSKEIISLIYGAGFSESREVLRTLIWLTPIIFLTNFTGSCLIAVGRQRQLAFISGFNTVFNVVLNLILIPAYGCVGAAVAALTTEGVNLIIQYRLLKGYWGASMLDISSLKLLFSLGLMGLLIHWLQGLNFFLILSGAVVLYVVSLYTTGFFSPKERSAIKDWLFQ